MTETTRRLRGARLGLVLAGLLVALLVAACGGSTPTPSPAASGGGIEGTWLLTSYTTPDGTNFTVPSAVTPTITFEGDAMSGNAGCNTFNSTFTLEGTTIKFGTIASTKVACQDPLATVEAAFLQALNLATTAEVVDGKLVIAGPDGKPSLTFVPGT